MGRRRAVATYVTDFNRKITDCLFGFAADAMMTHGNIAAEHNVHYELA